MKVKQQHKELSEELSTIIAQLAQNKHLTIIELCMILERETHNYLEKRLNDGKNLM
jgi:hypothetical protein